MGAASSRYESTNWDTADGGMSTDAPCLAGDKPLSSKTTVTFVKHAGITDERVYEVKDPSTAKMIVSTNIVEGTGAWFEVLKADGKKICRVKDFGRDTWVIYSYLKPAFDGQEPDPLATKDRERDKLHLYKTYKVEIDLGKVFALIMPFMPDETDKRGRPGNPVLQVEKVNSLTKIAYQASIPGQTSLVSYWECKAPITQGIDSKRIELEVAKGSDLTLHIIVALLANVLKEAEKHPFKFGDVK